MTHVKSNEKKCLGLIFEEKSTLSWQKSSKLHHWGHATILPRLLAKKYGEHLLDSLDSDGQDREYD